jgi:hypothetical protein
MAYMRKQTPIKKSTSRKQGSGLAKKVTGNTKPQTTNKFKKTQTSLTAPTKQNAQRKQKIY